MDLSMDLSFGEVPPLKLIAARKSYSDGAPVLNGVNLGVDKGTMWVKLNLCTYQWKMCIFRLAKNATMNFM